MLTRSDQEMVDMLSSDNRAAIQAAAYTIYVELTPNNKKPISQREFHQKFRDNWEFFMNTIQREYDEEE